MNTTLLSRLIWKECRQQRSFWLSVFGGAIGLIVLITSVSDHASEMLGFNGAVAAYLPICFALGSMAIAFAGERDDQTDVLLCRLAAPPGLLLGGKFFVAVAGSLLMWGLLAPLVSLTLATHDIRVPFGLWWSPQSSSVFRNAESLSFLGWTSLLSWLIGFLGWGLFFSLICQRVTSCLIATVICTACATPVIQLVLEQFHIHGDGVDLFVRLVVMPALLMSVNVWLVRRWPEGRWPPVIEFVIARWETWTTRGDRLAEQEQALLGREQDLRAKLRSIGLPADVATIPEMSPVVTRQQWWDAVLTPARRAAWRLTWLELRRARRVLLCALLVIVGTLLLTSFSDRQRRETYQWLPNFLWFLSALACGLSTFLPEHRNRQRDFFSHHAVSPTQIWVIKQLVWWPLAILLAAAPIMVVCVTHASEIRGGYLHSQLLHVFANAGWSKDWLDRVLSYVLPLLLLSSDRPFAELSPTLVVVVAFLRAGLLVSLVFWIGQLAAVVIPRAIVAIGTGLVSSLFGCALVGISIHLRVPLWLSVVPIGGALLWSSWRRWHDWLDERSVWRSFGRTAAIMGAVLIGTHLAVGWYRLAELPTVTFPTVEIPDTHSHGLPESSSAEETAALYREARQSHMTPVFFQSDDGPNFYQTANWMRYRDLEWQLAKPFHEVHNPTQLVNNAALVRRVEQIAQRPDCYFRPEVEGERYFGYATIRWSARPIYELAIPVKFLAWQHAADGKFDEALRLTQTLFQMARHARQWQGFDECVNSLIIENAASDVLQALMRRRDVTAEQIETLSSVLRERHSQLESFDHGALSWDYQLANRMLDAVANSPSFRMTRWFAPWEISRARHLLAVTAAEMDASRIGLPWSGFEPRYSRLPTSTIQPLLESRIVQVFWGHPLVSGEHQRRITDARTQHFASRFLLALVKSRQEHGRWPSALVAQGTQEESWLHDPWMGTRFSYWPDGLPVSIAFSNGTIKKGTPCFFSGGISRMSLEPPKPGFTTEWKLTSQTGVTPEGIPRVDALGFPLEE